MGMTIEDYIKIIKNWLYKGTNGLTNTRLGYMEGWFHKTDKEAFETAINIMRKYQKIEHIVNSICSKTVKEDERYVYEYLGDIKEVIEDGKID